MPADSVIGGELPRLEQQAVDGFVAMEIHWIEANVGLGLIAPEVALREFAIGSGVKFEFAESSADGESSVGVLAPAFDQPSEAISLLARADMRLRDIKPTDEIVARAHSDLVARVSSKYGESSVMLGLVTPEFIVSPMNLLATWIEEYLSE